MAGRRRAPCRPGPRVRTRRTAANDNGPGQIVAAGTVEQLQALADDPPAKARLMPLSVADSTNSPRLSGTQTIRRTAGRTTQRASTIEETSTSASG